MLLIYSLETLKNIFCLLKIITIIISYSDSQSCHRRPLIERRDHENALLFNYDGTPSSHHTKYGTNPLS